MNLLTQLSFEYILNWYEKCSCNLPFSRTITYYFFCLVLLYLIYTNKKTSILTVPSPPVRHHTPLPEHKPSPKKKWKKNCKTRRSLFQIKEKNLWISSGDYDFLNCFKPHLPRAWHSETSAPLCSAYLGHNLHNLPPHQPGILASPRLALPG